MLTRDQVLDLLSAAAAYDNRNPNEAALLAWSEAASRARWEFQPALDALHEHYARTTEFLMPGHITEALRAQRAQPVPARLALPARPPLQTPQHVAGVLAELARKLGWPGADANRRAVLARRCWHCGAQPGEPCTRPSERAPDGRVRTGFHPSRRDPEATS